PSDCCLSYLRGRTLMIRYALLLSAALLTALCAACAPPPAPLAQQPILLGKRTSGVGILRATCNNVDAFNAKLFILNQNPRFNPDDVFPDYTPPTSAGQF